MLGRIMDPADQMEYTHDVSIVREHLDQTTFQVAWSEGRTMTLEHAIEYALEEVQSESRQNPLPITQKTPPDVLVAITFGETLTAADVTYLRESLQLLRDKMPAWAQCVEEAKPLVLAVDLDEGTHGHAAVAKCCFAESRGLITFGHHFGTLADSSDPDSQSPEARRITFLATFAHEITHIRDQRAAKFLTKTNRKDCIAAEKSGLGKQLEFQQDGLTLELGHDAASTQMYHARLAQNVQAETAALRSRDSWDLYCGAFEK